MFYLNCDEVRGEKDANRISGDMDLFLITCLLNMMVVSTVKESHCWLNNNRSNPIYISDCLTGGKSYIQKRLECRNFPPKPCHTESKNPCTEIIPGETSYILVNQCILKKDNLILAKTLRVLAFLQMGIESLPALSQYRHRGCGNGIG